MKKKILLIVIASFMIMGVVSAASLWGTYKGNQVVKLQYAGIDVDVKDVPAVLLDGRTMIPLYLLKDFGISYNWDSKSQTVDVINLEKSNIDNENKPETPTNTQSDTISYNKNFIKGAKESLQKFFPVNYASINYSDTVTYIHFEVELSDNQGMAYYVSPAYIAGSYAGNFDFVRTYVMYNGVAQFYLDVDLNTARNYYLNNTIDELMENTVVTKLNTNINLPTVDTNYGTDGTTNNSVVTSKINGDFEGFDNGNIFELQNGQIWKQISYDYKYAYKYSPKVTIYKDGINWYMMVDGVDKQVKVEQIK